MTKQVVGKQLFKNPVRDLKALGLNVYGGGFTIGALKHFHVVGQWEEIKLGATTFALNFPEIHRPPDALKRGDWSLWPTKDYVDEVDFIFANPPCVPWSFASSYSERTGQVGTRSGKTLEDRFTDPLLHLTDHTMRTALKLRPQVFISESVENAFNIGSKHYVPYVKAWMKAGYSVTYFLTDALLHGAPCRRRRFHFIAHKMKLLLPSAPSMESFSPTTVRDAIGDLERRTLVDDGVFQHVEASAGAWSSKPYRRWLTKVPTYGMLRAILPKDFVGAKPSVFCRRLAWDIVAPTMMGFNRLIHPTGKRWITYREGMRLMTYPDEFRIAGKNDVAAYDAVIPIIATFLAGVAKRSIQENVRLREPEHKVIDWRPLGVGHSGKIALRGAA